MKKITNLRNLVLAMQKAPVDRAIIGKGLEKRLTLWIKRGEVVESEGMLSLTQLGARGW